MRKKLPQCMDEYVLLPAMESSCSTASKALGAIQAMDEAIPRMEAKTESRIHRQAELHRKGPTILSEIIQHEMVKFRTSAIMQGTWRDVRIY